MRSVIRVINYNEKYHNKQQLQYIKQNGTIVFHKYDENTKPYKICK